MRGMSCLCGACAVILASAGGLSVAGIGADLQPLGVEQMRSGLVDLVGENGSRGLPCILPCDYDVTPEGEPLCGPDYVDTYNGGCERTPVAFGRVQCGEKICGETGTYVVDGMEVADTDWFELVLTEDRRLTYWLVGCGGAMRGYILDAGSGDCADFSVIASGTAEEFDILELSLDCVSAGTYWIVLTPAVLTGIPCGSEYQAEVVCGACGFPCDPCDPDAAYEGEPDCGMPVDTVNGGCDSDPVIFGPQLIECGDMVCGTGARDGESSDADWYNFYHRRGDLSWCMAAEFAAEFRIIVPGGAGEECEAYEIAASATTGPDCEEICIMLEDAPRGMYWLWVSASPAGGEVPCGALYQGRVDCSWSCDGQVRGDCNCDGLVNNFDVDAFVLGLTGGQPSWEELYGGPGCEYICVADINDDDVVNGFDIDPFVALLMGD